MVDYDTACALFVDLRKKDPLRINDMDVFSHMLFVMVRTKMMGHPPLL